MSGDQSNADAAKTAVDVSFVIACFNAGEYLEPAIRSALNQQGVSIEVVVVDDGSTDGSRELVAALAEEDRRITLLTTPQNAGPAAARNLGMAAVRGKWYAVLDADDLILPKRSRTLLAWADRYDADMVADNLLPFGQGVVEAPMFSIAPRAGVRRLSLEEYFERSRLFGPEAGPGYLKPMIRRQAIERIGLRYNPELRIGEDDEFVIKALNARLKYVVCDYAGYRYRRHAASISHRLSLVNLERMMAAEQGIAAFVAPGIKRSAAYRGRLKALQRGHAFTKSIDELKAGAFVKAALTLARYPSALALYRMPLAARLRRLSAASNRLP